jgi:DNA-binding response OmpR family regulator
LLADGAIVARMAHILVQERDETVSELLERVLRLDGHKCSRRSRWEFADEVSAPDVLILDPWWPSATELGLRIRRQCPQVAVILTSNVIPADVDLDGLRPFRCLARPFVLGEVRAAVAGAQAQNSAANATLATDSRGS